MIDCNFADAFEALTGNAPFPWQESLYAMFSAGDIPASANLPTGLGKTSAIPVWLIALANGAPRLPRRLVYVVNRRTVVDQATGETERYRDRLLNPQHEAKTPEDAERRQQIARELRRLTASTNGPPNAPLAISTLRGQFADNREWSADPSRPAVILGTVDMIGSRLLFSGYGIGFKSKPLHAGFLGQDTLLVHDEAHLEPAFQELLIAIKREQRRCKEFRQFHVLELSATSRGSSEAGDGSASSRDSRVIQLTERDRAHPEIRKRIEAKKTIELHPSGDPKKLADQLAELAIRHKDSNRAVLVFARTVEVVENVAERLHKAKLEAVTLTGTMRGKERDDLVDNPVFHRFLPKASPDGETVYLICTSAGEVGVNLSADHLVCDLSTFESMAQRFGRVNRFGDRDDTQIDIIHPRDFDEKDERESRLKKTLELLRRLNGDGSQAALDELEPGDRRAAFSLQPTVLPVSDILFDAWAFTTIRDKMPGRPPVEPYLHGVSEYELPETHLAWREEVGVIIGPLVRIYHPEDLLEDYPLKPHELLRDASDRVFKRLASLAVKRPGGPVWLLDNDGMVEVLTLAELADKGNKDRINNRTVLIPPDVGGLKGGLLNGNPADPADDVSDLWRDESGERRRSRTWEGAAPGGMRLIRTIDTKPDADEEEESDLDVSSKRFWSWYVKPRSADDDGSKTGRAPVLWDVHTDDVVKSALAILSNLSLPAQEAKAVIVAARHHDLGKKRVVWQRSIGNPTPSNWLAKSGGKMKPIELTPYRHEFGSLLDVLDQDDFKELNEAQKDLVLHLIAVHHGFGRPHFPPDVAFDPEPKGKDAASINAEVPRRFARLQRRYGRWGLAYLESVLRAADYAASADPSQTVEGTR